MKKQALFFLENSVMYRKTCTGSQYCTLNIAPYRLFYDEPNLKNTGSSPMNTEQKQN